MRKCFSNPLKERLDKGRESRGRKTLSQIEIFFSIENKKGFYTSFKMW
jgi:hypothetical protein